MSLSSTKIEDEQGNYYNIDLLMPLDIFWKIKNLLKDADYLIASQEEPADVQAIYKNIFSLAGPYASIEADRGWLARRSGKRK